MLLLFCTVLIFVCLFVEWLREYVREKESTAVQKAIIKSFEDKEREKNDLSLYQRRLQ